MVRQRVTLSRIVRWWNAREIPGQVVVTTANVNRILHARVARRFIVRVAN